MKLLLAIAARLGLTDRAQKVAAWVMGMLLAMVVCGAAYGVWRLWLDRHDDRVVRTDRAASSLEVAKSQLSAERAAAAAKRDRDQAFAAEQATLTENIDAPIVDDNRTAVDAVFDRLR